jgi:hypothetical protein
MMRTARVIALMALLAGCGSDGGDSEEDVAERLESKGTMELMDEAAQDAYSAPQDNLLGEAQVQMYLKVRERELRIAEVSRKQLEEQSKDADQQPEGIGGLVAGMEAMSSVADLMTADIRAAQELGYNTAEYQWIKERVLEASSDAMREKMTSDMNAMLETQQREITTALENATSDAERQMYDQSLAGIEETRASMTSEPQEPWIAPNRKLLEAHEGALKALEVEYAKYSGTADDQAPPPPQ